MEAALSSVLTCVGLGFQFGFGLRFGFGLGFRFRFGFGFGLGLGFGFRVRVRVEQRADLGEHVRLGHVTQQRRRWQRVRARDHAHDLVKGGGEG